MCYYCDCYRQPCVCYIMLCIYMCSCVRILCYNCSILVGFIVSYKIKSNITFISLPTFVLILTDQCECVVEKFCSAGLKLHMGECGSLGLTYLRSRTLRLSEVQNGRWIFSPLTIILLYRTRTIACIVVLFFMWITPNNF